MTPRASVSRAEVRIVNDVCLVCWTESWDSVNVVAQERGLRDEEAEAYLSELS